VRLEFDLQIDHSQQAAASYKWQEWNFRVNNDGRDTHTDFSDTKKIPGMDEHVLMHNSEQGGLPFYANPTWYWITHLMGLGFIFRHCFYGNTLKVCYKVKKFIAA